MTPTIGELRALRVQQGLGLQEVAEPIGVHGSTVGAWEKGRHRPSPDRLRAYADVVGWQPKPPAAINRGAFTLSADWLERAYCRGVDVNVFFTSDAVGQERAKQFCRPCPVRRECLNWALAWGAAQEGIAGGLTAEERRQYQRNLTRRALRARAS